MDNRQVTPPTSTFDHEDYANLHYTSGSASTNASYYPHACSPESVMTANTQVTTPPRSPGKSIDFGPALLPRVRHQDQILGSPFNPAGCSHGRTTSLPSNAFPIEFGNCLATPAANRRSSSPPGRADLPTPGSTPLASDHTTMDPASRFPSISDSRYRFSTNIRSHSRSGSSTSIDASVLGRYGFPTYRQSPTPQPVPSNSVSMSPSSSAMSHLAPIVMPNGHVQSYPARRRTASPPANPSRLSAEVEFDPDLDLTESSILDYLTGPNPTPSLTRRTIQTTQAQRPFMWFDVRNVSAWSDFNISTISTIPGLLDLLQVKVTLRDLPVPGKVNLSPETPTQLTDLCVKFHAVKINAALKLAQGDKHMAMRTLQSTPSSRSQPEFVSNYQSNMEGTIYGNGCGRVVGIVKCYDQWNSGLRTGSVGNKVDYLKGLANLHYFLRENECRYGFIMTEIELVCVRAGGKPSKESTAPLFGCLEVADPVPVANSGKNQDDDLQMTVGLALWYLHMLAKEQPFPGQLHWKMDVGAPAALTRQHHLPRDEWMPRPTLSEKRVAKRVRGWVFPEEPFNNKEIGRGKRNKK